MNAAEFAAFIKGWEYIIAIFFVGNFLLFWGLIGGRGRPQD